MAWPTEAGAILTQPPPRRRRRRERKRRVQSYTPTWRRPVVIEIAPPRRRKQKRRRRAPILPDAALFRGRFDADLRGLYRIFNPVALRFHRDSIEALPERGLPIGWGDATLDAANGDLVYLFKLNETSGSVVDVINGLSGTAAGGPTYAQPGKVGTAIEFDGTDDEFLTGAAASLPAGDWTISFWVYLKVGNQLPISLELAGVRKYDVNLSGSETSWRRSSPSALAGSSTGVGQDAWHHLIITRISGDHAICLDGVALTMDAGTFNDVASLAGMDISIGESSTVYFNGLLDQIAIWKAALSAGQRAALYNAGDGRQYRANALDDLEIDTNASLPHTPTDTYADGTWKTGVTRFNGAIDSNLRPASVRGGSSVRVDVESTLQLIEPPQSPQEWRLEQKAGGVIRVVGFYNQVGALRATEWAITYTGGAAPAAPGLPPAVSPTSTVAMPDAGMAVLVFDLPALPNGFTAKVRLQTRRQDGASWRYSEAQTIKVQTAKATGPTAPQAGSIVQGSSGDDR